MEKLTMAIILLIGLSGMVSAELRGVDFNEIITEVSGSSFNNTYSNYSYNQTQPAITYANSQGWNSTFNSTYQTWTYNMTTNPAGLDTQVQFNEGGYFGGDGNFTWDYVNKVLAIGTTGDTTTALRLKLDDANAFDFNLNGNNELEVVNNGGVSNYFESWGFAVGGNQTIAGWLGINNGDFPTHPLDVIPTNLDSGDVAFFLSYAGWTNVIIGNGSTDAVQLTLEDSSGGKWDISMDSSYDYNGYGNLDFTDLQNGKSPLTITENGILINVDNSNSDNFLPDPYSLNVYGSSKLRGEAYVLTSLYLEYLSTEPGAITYIDTADGRLTADDTKMKITGNNVTIGGNLIVNGNVSMKIPYGMFSSTEEQTITAPAVPTPMTFNVIEDNYLINKTGNTNFSFVQPGDYLIELSIIAQGSQADRAQIWVQKNGVNVPRSNTVYDFKGSQANAVIAVPFIIDMNTTDKFRVMWTGSSEDVKLMYVTNTSYSPETPSAIMTITKVSEITP